MANFLLTFHGGSMPETKEAQDAVMAAWTGWFGTLGDALVDGGNPISQVEGDLARRLRDGRHLGAERLLDHQGRQPRRRRRAGQGLPGAGRRRGRRRLGDVPGHVGGRAGRVPEGSRPAGARGRPVATTGHVPRRDRLVDDASLPDRPLAAGQLPLSTAPPGRGREPLAASVASRHEVLGPPRRCPRHRHRRLVNRFATSTLARIEETVEERTRNGPGSLTSPARPASPRRRCRSPSTVRIAWRRRRPTGSGSWPSPWGIGRTRSPGCSPSDGPIPSAS